MDTLNLTEKQSQQQGSLSYIYLAILAYALCEACTAAVNAYHWQWDTHDLASINLTESLWDGGVVCISLMHKFYVTIHMNEAD